MEHKIRYLKTNGYVGFDSLPSKYVRNSVKNGFVFNIMCVGESGIGKTTLMNSLFKTTFESDQDIYYCNHTTLKSDSYDLKENDVRLKLTLCDTVSYGDDMNKQSSLKAITDYLDKQFELYFQQELSLKQQISKFQDTRIHVCLYFICPTGHGLKPLDLICMKKITDKVNIVPIIAKADTVSKNELQKFKQSILRELRNNSVRIYNCPLDEPSVTQLNHELNSLIPFAVIGSTDFVEIDEKFVRARHYPWGTVEIENESHCDFVKLREMLLRINTEDLKEKTHFLHYELYRKTELEKMGLTDLDTENKPVTFRQMFENKRVHLEQELAQSEELLRQKFELKIKTLQETVNRKDDAMMLKFRRIEDELMVIREKLEKERKKLNEEIIDFKKLATQHKKMGSSHNLLFFVGKKK
ncbi:hypothetical protein HHI36_012153 [Cryptolaemus montrouzieri]|uniref:Septin n=1 Tax=Cryptolaemus montrouzieri TaxID=559131 RepID=A0ABD2NDU1_9CUCU